MDIGNLIFRRLHIIGLLVLMLMSIVNCQLSTICAQTRVTNDYSPNTDKLRAKSSKRVNGSGLRTTAYDGVHHLVGLHVDGGYTAMFGNWKSMSTGPGGYTAGLGLDYCYTGRGLLIQTGIGVRWQDVSNRFANDSLIVDPATDSEGTKFRLQYDFENRIDNSRNIYVQIPLQAGLYFASSAYFLAGLKASMQVAGWTQTKLDVTTTATYNRYIGTWEEMDNHGIRKGVEEVREGDALKLRFDLLACAEIGYEWAFGNYGKKGYRKQNAKDNRLRLAAFLECGILDICPNTKNAAYTIPAATPYDFSSFGFKHMLSTTEAGKFNARNLFTGVKLTFFFYGYQSSEKCILCGPLGDEIKLR